MWNVSDYKDKYLKEMVEMTTEYYGEENDISDIIFINHEYFSNPAGHPYIKLALDEENNILAGQYIVISRDFIILGKRRKSVLSLNTLTRTAYQGQRIFTTLAEEVYRECQKEKIYFCYGAPNPNSFPGFINKLGFCNMGEIPLYLRLVKPFQLIYEKTHMKFLRFLAKIFDFSGWKCKEGTLWDYTFTEITEDTLGIVNVFWDSVKDKYPVIGERDSDYFLWRYIKIPRRRYKIIAALKNGVPCGYIIGRITKVAGMNCGMIVDFLFKKGETDCGNALIAWIKQYFDKKQVGLWGCLMNPETEEAMCLKQTGFFKCPRFLEPQPFPIIYRQFNPLEEEEQRMVDKFENWFFTMGDYDVI